MSDDLLTSSDSGDESGYDVVCVDFQIAIDMAIDTTEEEFERMAADALGVEESNIDIGQTWYTEPSSSTMEVIEHTLIEGVYYPE